MINNRESLSMSEAVKFLDKDSTENTDIMGFVKKFVKISPEEAKKFREKLVGLDLIKLREEHISKIIDLVPDNKEDLNKIFIDLSLDEDETNKILDTIKEFK
jgi:DNA-directed RNA polymerase subunit F